MASPARISPRLTSVAPSAKARPNPKLARPATNPFNSTTCSGLSWSILAVTPLSTPHERHAAAISSAPKLSLKPGLPGKDHARHRDQPRTGQDPAPQVLPEDGGRQQDRGGQLQVEEDRRRGRGSASQARHQERRPDGTAGHDRHQRGAPVAAQRHRGGGRANDRGHHREARPQIQQSSQHQRRDIAGQLRRGRRRRPEQHRSQQAAHDAGAAQRPPPAWNRGPLIGLPPRRMAGRS